MISVKKYNQMSSDEKTDVVIRVADYVENVLPLLVSAGRSIGKEEIEDFKNGIFLLSMFPQYNSFCMQADRIRSDYHQYIGRMKYLFGLLKASIASEMTVKAPNGESVIILQQSQTLRRGRPTASESEQLKKNKEEAARAAAISRLTGNRITTSEPAPIQERESDTHRRKRDEEPTLFDSAFGADTTSSEYESSQALYSDSIDSSQLPRLRSLMWLMPDPLVVKVKSLRDLYAERSTESEKAKLMFEQGTSSADMVSHTHRTKELNTIITDIFIEVDKHIAFMYVMLTDVNDNWCNVRTKYNNSIGAKDNSSFVACVNALKPYVLKVSGCTDSIDKNCEWYSNTLSKCKRLEAERIARETKDPEKDAEMHKMDAYIRRKDVKATEARLKKMKDYRAKLSEMGADADSLAAYDVFISSCESTIASLKQ